MTLHCHRKGNETQNKCGDRRLEENKLILIMVITNKLSTIVINYGVFVNFYPDLLYFICYHYFVLI